MSGCGEHLCRSTGYYLTVQPMMFVKTASNKSRNYLQPCKKQLTEFKTNRKIINHFKISVYLVLPSPYSVYILDASFLNSVWTHDEYVYCLAALILCIVYIVSLSCIVSHVSVQ